MWDIHVSIIENADKLIQNKNNHMISFKNYDSWFYSLIMLIGFIWNSQLMEPCSEEEGASVSFFI
jgi:hypothetical protein